MVTDDDTERLLHEAQSLAAATRAILDQLPPIEWGDLDNQCLSIAFRVSALRQVEAFEAAVTLAQHGAGHLVVGFIRPACDEYFWLLYLHAIEEQLARKVFLALAAYESTTNLLAQQQFTGKKTMKALGFPAQYVNQSAKARSDSRQFLTHLANRLEWPTNNEPRASPIPSTHWISNRAGQGRLYDYLYAATSRSLHFSAGEITRRAWGAPGGVLTFNEPQHSRYRTHFGVYWCGELLVRTLADAGRKHYEGIDEIPTEIGDSYLSAVRLFAPGGKVPLVIPEEFNLPRQRP